MIFKDLMINCISSLVKISMIMLWKLNHLLLEQQITFPIIHFSQRITITHVITVEHVIIIKGMIIMHLVILMNCLSYIH